MIVILDYGAGNLRSVTRAVERAGVQPLVTSSADDLRQADAVILPGVGAAADTMANLHRHHLVDPVREYIASGRPFLGVCMGLQALLTGSEERGWHPCLDVVPGRVKRLPQGLTVPHMGWNQVYRRIEHPVLRDIPDGSNFYFVHSYICVPEDEKAIVATTDYGGDFPSIMGRDNWVATQFHPEKSGEHGLKLYANFLEWAGIRAVTASPAR